MALSRRSAVPFMLIFAAMSAMSSWRMHFQTTLEEIPVGLNVAVFEKKQLTDGSPLRTWYTGITPLDAFLSMLVAAFMPAVAGWEPEIRLQQIYFLTQWFAVCSVWTVEAHRDAQRPSRYQLVSYPLPY